MNDKENIYLEGTNFLENLFFKNLGKICENRKKSL